MNPKPFFVSNHFTVPALTASEKHRSVLLKGLLRRLEEARKVEDTKERNMVEGLQVKLCLKRMLSVTRHLHVNTTQSLQNHSFS